MHRKKFDKLVVWSVDRVGRSMKHLVSVLSQLKDLEVDIYSYKQGIDTSDYGHLSFTWSNLFRTRAQPSCRKTEDRNQEGNATGC